MVYYWNFFFQYILVNNLISVCEYYCDNNNYISITIIMVIGRESFRLKLARENAIHLFKLKLRQLWGDKAFFNYLKIFFFSIKPKILNFLFPRTLNLKFLSQCKWLFFISSSDIKKVVRRSSQFIFFIF